MSWNLLRAKVRVTAAVTVLGALAMGLGGCGAQKVTREACPAGQVCLEYGNSLDPTSADYTSSYCVTVRSSAVAASSSLRSATTTL